MLKDILAAKRSLFADGTQTVLRGQENRNRQVAILQGNVVANVRSESRGICAQVSKNGYKGFASIADYSENAADVVLKAATENAEFLAKRAGNSKIYLPSYGMGSVPLNYEITDCKQKQLIDLCKEVDDYIVKNYKNLTSRYVTYVEYTQEKIIHTSDAFNGHITAPRAYIMVSLNSETKEGVPVELFETFGGFGCYEDNFKDTSFIYPQLDKVYKELMDKREGVYAEAGNKTVILGGILPGMIAHEAVGHTVEADLVLGGSVAGKNLGKQVASEIVNMVDFAHTAFGKEAPLPVYIDDEGTKAADAVLIENGILKGYMNNRETAEHFGVTPAGNARAWAFSDEPLIRMRNTTILPGKDKLEDMIASVDDGYYLCRTNNGQADLTGEFMFGICMGYEIKKGKLGRAILDTTVSGIAFDMLKTVDMISDEVVWATSGFCGKKQPMAVAMGGPQVRCKLNIGGR